MISGASSISRPWTELWLERTGVNIGEDESSEYRKASVQIEIQCQATSAVPKSRWFGGTSSQTPENADGVDQIRATRIELSESRRDQRLRWPGMCIVRYYSHYIIQAHTILIRYRDTFFDECSKTSTAIIVTSIIFILLLRSILNYYFALNFIVYIVILLLILICCRDPYIRYYFALNLILYIVVLSIILTCVPHSIFCSESYSIYYCLINNFNLLSRSIQYYLEK